eukprot:Gb_18258 [translate_table: standard]
MLEAILFLILLILFFIWKRAPFVHGLQSKHVLITGGSSGIGLEIAKEAVAQGSFVADISDYEAISVAINESFEWRPVDILVCNAALARSGYLYEVGIDEIDLIIRTNLTGTVYTLRVALPLMKKRSNTHPSAIVLMGSLASFHVLYGHGLYTATKYALRGLAECLRLELLPYKIGVSLVCPGFVETPMLQDIEDNIDSGMSEIASKVCFYNRSHAEDPREVAKATLEAVKQGRYLVTDEFHNLGIRPCGHLVAPSQAKT